MVIAESDLSAVGPDVAELFSFGHYGSPRKPVKKKNLSQIKPVGGGTASKKPAGLGRSPHAATALKPTGQPRPRKR